MSHLYIILFAFSFLLPEIRNPFVIHTKGYVKKDFTITFNLTQPDTTFFLSKELYEISGLSMAPEGNLISIDDEKGIYFYLNPYTGKITGSHHFGKDDDYEAVATAGDYFYIAESNGNIKKINYQENKKVDEYSTFLSKRNDVEGACYSREHNYILLACKEELEEADDYVKGVYAFDIDNEVLLRDPFITINLKEDLKGLVPYKLSNNIFIRLGTAERIRSFAPSAIDIDPCTGNYYILSSRGRLLLVLDPSGKAEALFFLPQKTFGQPEGLCFDSFGNLYISNEARGRKANLQYFSRLDNS